MSQWMVSWGSPPRPGWGHQWAPGQFVAVLQGNASLDHHWPHVKPIMLDVHHGVSRLFLACHMCSVGTLSQLWREEWRPVKSGVLLRMLVELHSAGLWALVPLEGVSLFLTVWSETCTPVACWRSFCRALAPTYLTSTAITGQQRSDYGEVGTVVLGVRKKAKANRLNKSKNTS